MKKLMRYPIILLITVLLAACSSPFITNLITPSGGILFQDDFSNYANGWSRVLESHGLMNYDNGGYRMWVNTPGYNYWSTAGQDFSDATIEVDATRVSGPEENRFGIICRYQDAQNYYFFIISSDGYMGIGKVFQGQTTLIGQDMMTRNTGILSGEVLNHLKASCIGNNLYFYINGMPAAMTTDDDIPNGDVGLITGAFDTAGVDIMFDNFVVYKP
jgi:hypothetical protein